MVSMLLRHTTEAAGNNCNILPVKYEPLEIHHDTAVIIRNVFQFYAHKRIDVHIINKYINIYIYYIFVNF